MIKPGQVIVEGSTGFVAVSDKNSQTSFYSLLRVLDISRLPQAKVLPEIKLPVPAIFGVVGKARETSRVSGNLR